MDKENILELRNVTKTFGDFVAVDSVDFALQAGEIHAILGGKWCGEVHADESDLWYLPTISGTDLCYGSRKLAAQVPSEVAA